MARRQRAAAAVAKTKIKHNVESINMTDAQAENRESSTPRAQPIASKPAAKSMEPQGLSKQTTTKTAKRDTQLRNQSSAAASDESYGYYDAFSMEQTPLSAHAGHLRRRAIHEVHNNKQKVLSRRTSIPMTEVLRVNTPPVYSPIYAEQLRFTPDASPPYFRNGRI